MAAARSRAGFSQGHSQALLESYLSYSRESAMVISFQGPALGWQANAWSAQSVRRHVGADWPETTLSHGILGKHAEPRGQPGFVERDQTKARKQASALCDAVLRPG